MNLFKSICTSILMTVSVVCVYGQEKKIDFDPGDKGFYQEKSDAEKRLHLPDMKITIDGRHWRFWYDKYIAGSFVIDITGPDSINCKAFITVYTYGDVVLNEKNKFGKIYHEEVDLDQEVARTLYHAATRVNISRFSRKDTVGHSVRTLNVLDVSPYTVEYADDQSFHFKTGLKPENIAQFNAFIDTAIKLIDFEKLKNNFEKNIPFGYYSSEKWVTYNRKLTPKQIRQFRRYWRKHPD